MLKEDKYYDYSDVLIKPVFSQYASRKDAVLVQTYTTKHSRRTISGVPIIAANMDSTGTIEMALALQQERMYTALHKYYTAEQIVSAVQNGVQTFERAAQDEPPQYLDKDYFFVSIGYNYQDMLKVQKIKKVLDYDPHICVDVANGYTKDYIDFLAAVRATFPDSIIMAGNVATPEIIDMYDKAGVDIVKVGIGPGNFCRTRTTAGVGIPQLSAVMTTSEAAVACGLMICADGGINDLCDFAKAFIGGADFVMAGSMFAAHDESGGDLVEIDGVMKKLTYGMSSEHAMKKYSGKVSDYRASEGRVAAVTCKGPVSETLRNILGSLRSTMTYTDVRSIAEFYKADMILVNRTINTAHVSNTVGI